MARIFASLEGRFDIRFLAGHAWAMKPEIIFEVTDAEEGGYCASALGYGINTQAETVEELRSMVREAVDCYFDDPSQAPKIIRLHFVRDEVLEMLNPTRSS
jgi:predicted RNase H-like HicB family nuclease